MTELISIEEQKYLLSWIKSIEHKFKENGYSPHRKYFVFNNNSSCPYLLYDIKNRIIKKENLENWREEPYLGDYIGWISNGGMIHHHIDPNCKGIRRTLYHVRYNLFLSIPENGGTPMYDNKIINAKERECVMCKSGEEYHSCQKVIGEKPRIVISYGFLR
jgi:hypothetical protein